jgi:hypothetical protein
MGLLKKILWPDHPDEVAARKDVEDIASRAPARLADDRALQSLWVRLLPSLALYDGPDWFASYKQRPIDDSGRFDWNLGNFVQDLEFFRPLMQRVPADISAGMPSNVKRSVVRAYWEKVTNDAIHDLTDLIEARELITAVRSPEHHGYVNDYYWYADRFCLYHLPYLIADTQVTRGIWNEDAVAKNHWLSLAQRANEARQRELANFQSVLRILAEEQPEDFKSFGYTPETLEFLGLADLAD